jgi:hypothetical protein
MEKMNAMDKYIHGFYSFKQLLNESNPAQQEQLIRELIDKKCAEMHKSIDKCKTQILNELFG